MKKLPFLLFILWIAVLFFPACEVENCPPNTMSYIKFSFVNQHGKAVQLIDTTSIIGMIHADVTVYDTLDDGTIKEEVVYDSLIHDTLINREVGASGFEVPLSYSDKTSFILAYLHAKPDTIHISHRNIPYVTNLDCGTMMLYEIQQATSTRHQLDSIQIINPNIDNNEKENIKIYFTVTDTE